MQEYKKRIKEVASDEGYRLARFNKKNNIHAIAQDFEKWAKGFLQEMPQPFLQYDKKLETYFRFVELIAPGTSDGMDAWVSPIFVPNKHSFVIFVSLEMLRGVSDKLIEMKGEKKHLFPLLAASFSFIFLHEWSHIVKAHIPFLFTSEYKKEQRKISFHIVKSRSTQVKTPRRLTEIRIQRAMEIDADLMAITLINQFLAGSLPISPLFKGPFMNNAAIYGEAVAITTRLLEQWRRSRSGLKYNSKTGEHPHPDIRYLFLEAWMGGANRRKENKQYLETFKGFKKGFNKATKQMDLTGKQFFPLFDHLRTKGAKFSLAEYKTLETDLTIYLRPGLLRFHI